MEKVAKGTFAFDGDEWEDISKEAKEFIKKMLTYDPGTTKFILIKKILQQKGILLLNV